MIIYWLKRDLRLQDNPTLNLAIEEAIRSNSSITFIYIFEPSLVNDEHYSNRHWRFVNQSLQYLQAQLLPLKTSINVFFDEVLAVFKYIQSQHNIFKVYSHQETGILKTFKRDLQLKKYFQTESISWNEIPQIGIQRARLNREGWIEIWRKQVNERILSFPINKCKSLNWITFDSVELDNIKTKNWEAGDSNFQLGGENHAHSVLNDFVTRLQPLIALFSLGKLINSAGLSITKECSKKPW